MIYIYTHECICIKIVSYLYYPFNKISRQAWKNLLVPGKIRQGDLHVLEISLLNGWLMVKLGGHRNYSFAKGLIIQTFLIIYLYIHMYIYIYISFVYHKCRYHIESTCAFFVAWFALFYTIQNPISVANG